MLLKANVEAPVNVVALAAADLGPLEDDLDDHVDVHGDDAEPQDTLLPAIAHAQKRDSKSRLRPCLTDQSAT